MWHRIPNLTINELVAENYQYASVLHFFGIELYNYAEEKLNAICRKKGLNVQQVIQGLETVRTSHPEKTDYRLRELPVDVVIEYLKLAHQSFIRHKLPYMADLIRHISPDRFGQPSIAEDLQFIFPIFMEDFIHHIYEEEKQHFGYIERLREAVEKGFHLPILFQDLANHSIAQIMNEHAEEDDEMKGIRELTHHYEIKKNTPLYTKVIYSELKAFEKDLKVHSTIENNILFPKALELERKAANMVNFKAKLN